MPEKDRSRKKSIDIYLFAGGGLLAGMLIMYAAQSFFLSSQSCDSPEKESSRAAASPPDPEQAAQAGSKTNEESQTKSNSSLTFQHSPEPVSAALAIMQQEANKASQHYQYMVGQETLSFSETVSGYPVATGGRAVDGAIPHFSGQPVHLNENGLIQEEQKIGRNGLIANPCADPPSSRGAAYSRYYY